jgi:uncharacterized protein YndB with AHSA1/START domain
MLKKIVLVALLLLATPLIVAATKPNTLKVERTTSIQASPEKVFASINDFRRWSAWSPYEALDPTMKRTYSGAASGKGAVYEWEGNDNVGAGRMEIVDVADPSRVTIKLDFIKPFEGHNIAEFRMEPRGDATRVTWAMDGECPFIMKLMSVFMNTDDMIGKDFETGLANLKVISES